MTPCFPSCPVPIFLPVSSSVEEDGVERLGVKSRAGTRATSQVSAYLLLVRRLTHPCTLLFQGRTAGRVIRSALGRNLPLY